MNNKPYQKYFTEEEDNPQIHTPEFKKWFGNSKVVKNGKPLIVYHGSNAKFNVFTKTNTKEDSGDYIGEGYYFATNPETAKKYGGKVQSYYLKIVNPVLINNKGDIQKYYDFISSQFNYNELENIINQTKEKIDEYVSIAGKAYIYFQIKKKNPSMLKKKLESLKYDGLIDNVYGQYAVFNSKQIKSATDNNGKFDKNNLNITEEFTSASIPQKDRPENVKKVVKIGSLAKTEQEIEEGEYDADFYVETEEDVIEEEFLRNIKNKDEVLDMDFKDVKKNKLVDKR